jgi:hypothetical protein
LEPSKAENLARNYSERGDSSLKSFECNRPWLEELLLAKLAKIKLHEDVYKTTFSVFGDIFYPANVRCFEENESFQQPGLLRIDQFKTW